MGLAAMSLFRAKTVLFAVSEFDKNKSIYGTHRVIFGDLRCLSIRNTNRFDIFLVFAGNYIDDLLSTRSRVSINNTYLGTDHWILFCTKYAFSCNLVWLKLAIAASASQMLMFYQL